MKPFHQWLSDQVEELNPTEKAVESEGEENYEIARVVEYDTPVFSKSQGLTAYITNLSEKDRIATGAYLVLGYVPTSNDSANEFMHLIAIHCDCKLLYGYDWKHAVYADELQGFEQFVKPFVRTDLITI